MSQSPADLMHRYNDWCTAIIAEHLTGLTPHHVFDAAYREQPVPNPARVEGVEGGDLVQQLLGRLPNGSPELDERLRGLVAEIVASLQLPSFEDWVVSYRANPASYDRMLLGFRSTERSVDETMTPNSGGAPGVPLFRWRDQ